MKLTEKDSPITAETISLSGLAFSDVQACTEGVGAGRLFFRCTDPAKQGRSAVLSISSSQDDDDDDGPLTHTAAEHNVRSAVHEYGGGSFAVFSKGLVYTDFPSFKVYRQALSSSSLVDDDDNENQPVQIFPVDDKHSACRLADFCVLDSEGTYLVAIMEDHSDPAPDKVVNSLIALKMDGSGSVQTIATGLDFYSSPSFDSTTTKKKLAFVGWNHPNMPWDDTTLYVVDLDSANGYAPQNEPVAVHGANAGSSSTTTTVSVYAPQWHPTSGDLIFLSDVTGWYNLYKWSPADDKQPAVPLFSKEAEFSASYSGWMLGIQPFCFLENGTIAGVYTDLSTGGSVVALINPNDDTDSSTSEHGRSSLPPTSISSLCAGPNNSLYFLGGGIKEPVAVWCWDAAGTANNNEKQPPARRLLSSLKVDNIAELEPFMSEPRSIKAKTTTGVGTGHCYAFYYPPNNLSPNLLGSDFAPPMLVRAHGGPTASTSTTFRLDIHFWTSRGFAVLDVNYGGSTGYGKEYRQSLYGQWGILDVQDVAAAAQHCVDTGHAKAEWLCIDGSSAGGYTTLAALTFSNQFRAGASKYGIGDLSKLAEETHKFESRYMDRLIGPYPAAKAIYDARCPTLHTDKLNAPMILLQGDEDKVVPPNQAVDMFEVSKAKGIPTALVMYKGEQHGFRKAENMKHSLLSEYYFFCKVFGLEPQAEGGFAGVRMNERVDV